LGWGILIYPQGTDVNAISYRFGLGSICGPILGGVFTDRSSWRWCFYFNLPVGAVTLITLLLYFHPPKRAEATESFWRRFLSLDLPGNGILITAVAMLLLALQWGGDKYAWKSSQIIGLLVGAGLGSLGFVVWQNYRGRAALIPFYIIGQRTVAASFGSSFFIVGATLVHAYYLPIWFQAIRDDSPIQSGVHLVPYVASNFFFSMVAGILVTKTGYFNPPALMGPIVATIGCGLLTTLRVDTSTAKWVGFEILTATGVGMTIQQGIIAVQAVLPLEVVPIGTALVLFAQSLSGSIFVSVGSSLLRNELSTGLSEARLPGVNITEILSVGATEVRDKVPVEHLAQFLVLYNSSLQKTFILAIPLAALGFFAASLMEWRSLKGTKEVTQDV
jgi:MFS family permease